MNTECINNIELKTNNKEIISVSEANFKNLYISNIDNNGDEINYERVKHSSSLYANFFMIKLLKSKDAKTNNIVDRILNQKDIVKIGVNFNNGAYQEFELAKKRIANNGLLENVYEEAFLNDDHDLCILISDKKLKYKTELFI